MEFSPAYQFGGKIDSSLGVLTHKELRIARFVEMFSTCLLLLGQFLSFVDTVIKQFWV